MTYKIILATLLCLSFIDISAQTTIKITGTVTEVQINEPLTGAVIRVKGTDIATTTDTDGTYRLNIPNERGIILECSFLGLKTIETEVKDNSTINFEMTYEEPSGPSFIFTRARDIDIYGSSPHTHFGIGYTAIKAQPFWRTSSYRSFLSEFDFSASYHTDFSDNMVVKSEIKEMVIRGI